MNRKGFSKVLPVLIMLFLAFTLLIGFQTQFPTLMKVNAATLTTYTTRQDRIFAPNFTSTIHIDIPPSHFAFFPNGTVQLMSGPTISLAWSFAIIPLQTPTSFQANNSYVLYSARGPAQCVVSVSFKQQYQNGLPTNVALFGMSGTSANPCASATFSIKLNAYGSNLQTFNATGGSTGTICNVKLASIAWDWCTATLSNVTISFNANTIQIRNTAQNWSFLDPLSLDGNTGCSDGSNGICTSTISTANANDILIVQASLADGGGLNAPFIYPNDTAHNIYHLRAELPGTNGIYALAEFYTILYTTVTNLQVSVVNPNINGKESCIVFAIAGTGITPSSTKLPFDSNNTLPAVNQTQTGTVINTRWSTQNNVTFNFALGSGSTVVSKFGGDLGSWNLIRNQTTDNDGRAIAWYDITVNKINNKLFNYTRATGVSLLILDSVTNATATGTTSTVTNTVTTTRAGSSGGVVQMADAGFTSGTTITKAFDFQVQKNNTLLDIVYMHPTVKVHSNTPTDNNTLTWTKLATCGNATVSSQHEVDVYYANMTHAADGVSITQTVNATITYDIKIFEIAGLNVSRFAASAISFCGTGTASALSISSQVLPTGYFAMTLGMWMQTGNTGRTWTLSSPFSTFNQNLGSMVTSGGLVGGDGHYALAAYYPHWGLGVSTTATWTPSGGTTVGSWADMAIALPTSSLALAVSTTTVTSTQTNTVTNTVNATVTVTNTVTNTVTDTVNVTTTTTINVTNTITVTSTKSIFNVTSTFLTTTTGVIFPEAANQTDIWIVLIGLISMFGLLVLEIWKKKFWIAGLIGGLIGVLLAQQLFSAPTIVYGSTSFFAGTAIFGMLALLIVAEFALAIYAYVTK